MTETSLKTGDVVFVSAHGQERVPATVVVASSNGRSLMLEFPGGLFRLADAGAYIGVMPVLQRDDGTWIELINQREIVLHEEHEVTAIYRSLSVADLEVLRAAFELDSQTDRPATVAFCQGRIAMIDAELERRK